MKHIHVILENSEYRKISLLKKPRETWRDVLLSLSEREPKKLKNKVKQFTTTTS